jgi:hypothetical protein
MNFLHFKIVLFAFAISCAGGDRWDCPSCGGGPANSPGGQALDTCAGNCLQAAPAGSRCDDNTSSDCICNSAHYSLAIRAIANCVVASCTIAQDLAAATSVASTWCAQWSQTATPAPVPTSGKWLFNGCGIIAMTIFVTQPRVEGEMAGGAEEIKSLSVLGWDLDCQH